MFRGYMMSNSPFWTGNDATGRPVHLSHSPQRIVSLVPSQTELLVDLGIAERLIGRTRYCIHPREKLSSVAVIGGTKKIDFEKIKALKPDLILAEKEENPLEMVESLSALAPVYVTDVTSISSAISMCKEVGVLTGLRAEPLATQIETAMNEVKGVLKRPERVLYLIWRTPQPLQWMGVGTDTFIHSCLDQIGFQNVVNSSRYPEFDQAAVLKLNPERIFLSSEPFPFKEAHLKELQELLPHARIEFVDGELFSWYGSRMLKMPRYWKKLISS